MTLHLFNPEHDIALAAHLAHFTPPHAARQLKADLCWLPALWANADDAVLVENAEYSRKACSRRLKLLGRKAPQFVERQQLPQLKITRVEPWGWDAALATDLEGTVGEAVECATLEQVEGYRERWGQIVVKSPWSSSGRGVHFSVQEGWINNVLKVQGSVMVEPYYNKVKDFGMEFERDKDGQVRYLGLSLFHTKNGAYIGNLLVTENTKREQISRYISTELLDKIKQNIIENIRLDDYVGPFGIDMMIVNADGKWKMNDGSCLLHPCVELNLRRTMGHVALSMTPIDNDICKVMRIEQMHLRIKTKKRTNKCSLFLLLYTRRGSNPGHPD